MTKEARIYRRFRGEVRATGNRTFDIVFALHAAYTELVDVCGMKVTDVSEQYTTIDEYSGHVVATLYALGPISTHDEVVRGGDGKWMPR